MKGWIIGAALLYMVTGSEVNPLYRVPTPI